MDDELMALEANKTWILTDLPPNKTLIGCRWVFKIKRRCDGSIEWRMARLVAKGYNQLECLDYLDIFVQVLNKLSNIRLLLAYVVLNNWSPKQIDVNNDFLTDIFMKIPPGLAVKDKTKVCKLQHSLYGLK